MCRMEETEDTSKGAGNVRTRMRERTLRRRANIIAGRIKKYGKQCT